MPVVMSPFEIALTKFRVLIPDAERFPDVIATQPSDDKNMCVGLSIHETDLRSQTPLPRLLTLLRSDPEVVASTVPDFYWLSPQLFEQLAAKAYTDKTGIQLGSYGGMTAFQPPTWIPGQDLLYRCFPHPWRWILNLSYATPGKSPLLANSTFHSFILVDVNGMPRDAATFLDSQSLRLPCSDIAKQDAVIVDAMTNREILAARRQCERRLDAIEKTLVELRESLPKCKTNSTFEYKLIANHLGKCDAHIASCVNIAVGKAD